MHSENKSASNRLNLGKFGASSGQDGCANAEQTLPKYVLLRGNLSGNWFAGAGGENRTLTMLPSADFESAASTVPPHRPARVL